MPSSEVQIHGYAIISDDDRIADSSGRTPPSLRNDADWTYFQRELDRADLVAIGRRGHEANANAKNRRRLVLSSAAHGLERRGDDWWWDPNKTAWSEVVAILLPTGGRVAVPGGQAVFDLFKDIGYDVFHLTRARGVLLPGGRALFAACDQGMSAEAALMAGALRLDGEEVMDAPANITLALWRKP
jgi:hypothetical protein